MTKNEQIQEILNYIIALEKQSKPAILDIMKQKFNNISNLDEILQKLLSEGEIYEPIQGIYRWLG